MSTEKTILSTVRYLLADQLLAVLATENSCQPYASLVAFAVSPDLRQVYFATRRTTRKFTNMTANANVALLMDDRAAAAGDFSKGIAVTVLGVAKEITGKERDSAADLFLARHPNLADFAAETDCALMAVSVRSYVLVDRFQRVYTYHCPP